MADTATDQRDRIIATYGESQRRAVLQATIEVARLWRELQGSDLSGSWASGVGRAIRQAVSAGQLLAAGTGQAYVDAMVTASHEASEYVPGATMVNPLPLSGVAADGRSLDSLLYLPVIRTKELIQSGSSLHQALLGGEVDLQRMVSTEIVSAGGSAARIAMTANRQVTGYVRCIRPGACARCAILAGRVYHWNADFARHAHCQCYGTPTTRSYKGHTTDVNSFFSGLSQSEQNRRFTIAGAQAIRDGANISSVVNARRGMSTVTAYGRRLAVTSEGTTRFGDYYRQSRAAEEVRSGTRFARGSSSPGLPQFRLRTPRLMPEELYRMTQDREEITSLLRKYGYLH